MPRRVARMRAWTVQQVATRTRRDGAIASNVNLVTQIVMKARRAAGCVLLVDSAPRMEALGARNAQRTTTKIMVDRVLVFHLKLGGQKCGLKMVLLWGLRY